MINRNETAQENASRMMNEKYGKNNWTKKSNNPSMPGKYSDYSKIVKWIQRGGYLNGVISFFDYEKTDIFP